ncbi:type IV pilus modification PilV family protein [Duganella sp. S19_KUP01_CR8]|uniref:type IV pilus modification PilV family protein n=1 Tax=Duganella sp. S19_KUP01_CR8 TaxID=3025502 RepID=UPI002FCDC6AC
MKTAIHTTTHRRPARRQGGIALLEAMLAIVILGIGLIGTLGLQARAYSALSDASLRAEATLAGEKLLGTMNADSNNLLNYGATEGGAATAATQPWVDETKAAIPGAIVGVVVVPQQLRVQVDISIRWKRKSSDALNQHLVTSYIAL